LRWCIIDRRRSIEDRRWIIILGFVTIRPIKMQIMMPAINITAMIIPMPPMFVMDIPMISHILYAADAESWNSIYIADNQG
jgi:hypothetical protein